MTSLLKRTHANYSEKESIFKKFTDCNDMGNLY